MTRVQQAIRAYLTATNSRDKLIVFNKIVDICQKSVGKLFLPSNTLGVGKWMGRVRYDDPVRDFMEVVVLQELMGEMTPLMMDYLPHRCRQRFLKEIRRRTRSREDDFLQDVPEEK